MLDYEFYHVLSGIVAALSFGFSVSALLYFLLLRKVQNKDMSEGAQIPRFICSLSLTVALLELLYLLMSTLLHTEFFASVAWPVVFFGTLISLFYLLPFAYFIIESVGLQVFAQSAPPPRLHKKERRVFFTREDLLSQIAEALLNSALFALILFGVVILMGLIPFARRASSLPRDELHSCLSSTTTTTTTTSHSLFSRSPICSLDDLPSSPHHHHHSWFQFFMQLLTFQSPSSSSASSSSPLSSTIELLAIIWDYLALAYYVVMHGSAILFAAISPAGINRLTSFLRHTVRLPHMLQRIFSVFHSSTTIYTLLCTALQLASLTLLVNVELSTSDNAFYRLLVNVIRLFDTFSLAQYWICSLVGLYQFQLTKTLRHNTIPSMIYTTALVVLISTSMPAASASLGLQSKSFNEMGFMAPFSRRYNPKLGYSIAGAVFLASYLFNNDDIWRSVSS